jgi:2,3-bisphosphoglycerate-independent phosphoglycerate mutase
VPSLKVATYDLAPEMQTPRVCDLTCSAIDSGKYPFIVLNLANPDMVGHTGILEAGVQAVESVDRAFGRLVEATRAAGGTLFITADHGNIEQMIDLKTGEPHTAHTTNPVPFIVADFSGRVDRNLTLTGGALEDVAPTILQVMNISQPKEMTGKPLLKTLTTSK